MGPMGLTGSHKSRTSYASHFRRAPHRTLKAARNPSQGQSEAPPLVAVTPLL